MFNISEKLGDFCYEVASKYISFRTKLPTRVDKQIVDRTMVDGVFREDASIEPGWAMNEVMRIGRAVNVTNERRLRRRIVFIDDFHHFSP